MGLEALCDADQIVRHAFQGGSLGLQAQAADLRLGGEGSRLRDDRPWLQKQSDHEHHGREDCQQRDVSRVHGFVGHDPGIVTCDGVRRAWPERLLRRPLGRRLGEVRGSSESQAALIEISLGLASSRLGSTTVSSPSLKSALILLRSTAAGRWKLRTKLPWTRSMRW